MGVGVAESLARAGHETVLVDVSDGILARSASQIRSNVRFGRLLGYAGGDADRAPAEISYYTDYARLGDVDFVIESVTERWDVKKQVYPLLAAACPEHCVFAANTSAIPITRIASATLQVVHGTLCTPRLVRRFPAPIWSAGKITRLIHQHLV